MKLTKIFILIFGITKINSAHGEINANLIHNKNEESHENSNNKHALDTYLSEKSRKVIQKIAKMMENDDKYQFKNGKNLEQLVYYALHNQSKDFDRGRVNKMIEKWIDENLSFLNHNLDL